MSMSLLVPICASLMSVADVNAAFRDAGFDMVMEQVDLSAHSGYLPVRFEGQVSGFEYYINEADDFEAPAAFGVCSHVVMLDVSLDHEVAAAFAFAGVLAQSTRSGVLDPQEDRWLTPDDALGSARTMSAALERPFYQPGNP